MIGLVFGCGGGSSPDDPDPVPCTAEAQEVPAGEALTFEMVDLGFGGGSCAATHLITTQGQLDAEFGGTPPTELDDVDFALDRIVLGSSNPVLRFAVEATAGDLFVGEEPLCQGIAPSCVAYVLRDVTSDVLTVIGCPYNGPDPCLAP
jgi:hypothetical protein